MPTSTKGVPTAVRQAWKFVVGDKVIITRGRSKGRMACIQSIQRDGRTGTRLGRRQSKKRLLHCKENPRVYLDGHVHQVRWHALLLMSYNRFPVSNWMQVRTNERMQGYRTITGGDRKPIDRPLHISNISHVVEKDGKMKAVRIHYTTGEEAGREVKVPTEARFFQGPCVLQ
jgi:ribosomal protein L24